MFIMCIVLNIYITQRQNKCNNCALFIFFVCYILFVWFFFPLYVLSAYHITVKLFLKVRPKKDFPNMTAMVFVTKYQKSVEKTMSTTISKKQVVVTYNDEIKKNNQFTVNGYVRQIDKSIFAVGNKSFFNNIPVVINYVVLRYYHVAKDRFDPILHAKGIKVTEDTAERLNAGAHNSAFLSNVVISGIHRWRFKLQKRESLTYIGVWKNEYDATKPLNGPLHENMYGNKAVYALNTMWGELRGDIDEYIQQQTYCAECKTGDVIDMYLDLNKFELKFSVNDKDHGKAFDVDQTSSYRAAVNMEWSDSVKLVFYKFKLFK